MTPDDLQAWRRRRGYTIAKAAAMLGMGRPGFEHYLYGQRQIPRRIELDIMRIDRNPKAAERDLRQLMAGGSPLND